jgi:membrane fusion protein (multidrug efflux system)
MSTPGRRFAVFLVCGWFLAHLAMGCRGSATQSAEEEAHPAPVKVASAKMESLADWTELLGTTQPLPGKSAQLSAAVSSRVISVLGDVKGPAAAEGQEVDRGRVIARLDDSVAEANRDRAKAALDELVEQAKLADFGIDLATIDLKTREKLQPAGMPPGTLPLVTQVELEKARIALKEAESRKLLVQAKAKTAQAELQGLNKQLELYAIRAPFKGRLGRIRVSLGQTLAVGAPVAEILNLDEIDVLCFAPPHLVGKLKPDLPARLVGKGEPASGEAPGKVHFVAVQAEPETGSFAVKVRFQNPGLTIRSGRVVGVEVQTRPEAKRWVIPEAALMEDQDPPGVVVVEQVQVKEHEGKKEKTGKARRLQARIGVRQRSRQGVEGLVEVLALTDPETHKEVPLAGVLFVTEGGAGLASDDQVAIREDEHEGKQ